MKLLVSFFIFISTSLDSAQSTPNKSVSSDSIRVNNEKIELVNTSFDRLVDKLTTDTKENSMWNTLIPLLIGAGLTLFSQYFIEEWKQRREIKTLKRDLISKGKAKTYIIWETLKILAMYQVHKNYYYRAHEMTNNGKKKEEDTDSYKKHYEKGQERRQTKLELDKNISEYFEIVTKYALLTQNNELAKSFEDILNYKYPKAKKFSNCNSEEELIIEASAEEQKLVKAYKDFYKLFEDIQNSLMQG